MEVGVIGLGAMGSPIAANLIAAGHKVTVYNRTASKARDLVAQGASLAGDPSEAAKGDAVLTMLANDEAVDAVVFGQPGSAGDAGLIAGQGINTIHISMSTISPKLVARINDESAQRGKPFISAPVMGRPDVAKRRELIVMPSGDKAHIERCRPIFEAIGKCTKIVGGRPEQANLVKLSCNFMLSSMIETFSEAFALLRKNGIDHHKLVEIMADEFFQSAMYSRYGNLIASGEFHTGAFTVTLQEKDTRLALDAAIQSKVPMPLCALLENVFLSAIGRGKGDLDPCAIAEVAAENAGLK